jgi:hypothetical protein
VSAVSPGRSLLSSCSVARLTDLIAAEPGEHPDHLLALHQPAEVVDDVGRIVVWDLRAPAYKFARLASASGSRFRRPGSGDAPVPIPSAPLTRIIGRTGMYHWGSIRSLSSSR